MVRDGFVPMKLKRKEIDDFNDDFSDFSLSSPALKIRRLDADLPPIMEEDEPILVEPPQNSIEVFDSEQKLNEERAIVLFKPPNGNFTLSVDPDVINAYNRNTSRFFSSSDFPNMKWEDGDDQSEEHKENKCLAVVPWVAPLQPPTNGGIEVVSQSEAPEFMEADECGPADMEVEDTIVNPNVTEGGLPWQQQQQHCLIPQLPHSTSTPITWFQ